MGSASNRSTEPRPIYIYIYINVQYICGFISCIVYTASWMILDHIICIHASYNLRTRRIKKGNLNCFCHCLSTWRIILVSKWLVTPIYKPWKGHLEAEQPYLGDLLTMDTNNVSESWEPILQVLKPAWTWSGLKIRDPPSNSTVENVYPLVN